MRPLIRQVLSVAALTLIATLAGAQDDAFSRRSRFAGRSKRSITPRGR